MKRYGNLFNELCSYENLFLAYKKARKHKTTKHYVLKFEEKLEDNLLLLRSELLLHCYKPKPLVNFIIRDPKTRKISKSDFKDRVVHHALCNIIEPIFEKKFIYDSYANRKGKGTLKAIERFDCFKRKVSVNNIQKCFVLKADIKHYFDEVNHNALIDIIKNDIKDPNIIWLIKVILKNYKGKTPYRGRPLGNLTSQFFANIYLNELDHYVKSVLNIKYYIRYVDDFVIFGKNECELMNYKNQINQFIKNSLQIELHPEKCKIIQLNRGIPFLGFRIFYYHRILKRSNVTKFKNNLKILKYRYNQDLINYDSIYNKFEGWIAYSKNADTCKMRKNVIRIFEETFPNEISAKDIQRFSFCSQ
jgi:retron-type reverse transcriptase